MGRGYSEKYYRKHKEIDEKWATPLARLFIRTLGIRSMLDLGCGVGSYLRGALEENLSNVVGVEMNADLARPFMGAVVSTVAIQGDITKPLDLHGQFDCVLSVETGEHLQPEGTAGFIDNLKSCSSRLIVLTAAPPGQRGTQHINLRPRSEWIAMITEDRQFAYQSAVVEQTIKTIYSSPFFINGDPPPYITRNLMIFSRVKGKP